MLTNFRSPLARKILQWTVYAAALVLLAASIRHALQGQDLADWWSMLKDQPGLTAAFFVTVGFSSVILPGLQFWLITRPFATSERIPLLSMQALSAGGVLLNYTPFKAGLIGRVTYLKLFHGVGLRAALYTNILITLLFMLTSMLAVVVTAWRGGFDLAWWLTMLTSLLLMVLISTPLLRYSLPGSIQTDPLLRGAARGRFWYLAPCYAVQMTGLFVTALRWWLVFLILDKPVALAEALVIAFVHMLSIAIGPANGLGLREWLIALGSEFGVVGTAIDLDMRISMSAALIDRGVEAIVVIALGLLGLAYLKRLRNVSGLPETGSPAP